MNFANLGVVNNYYIDESSLFHYLRYLILWTDLGAARGGRCDLVQFKSCR